MDVERGIILDDFCRFWSHANMGSGLDGCPEKETAYLNQRCTFYERCQTVTSGVDLR